MTLPPVTVEALPADIGAEERWDEYIESCPGASVYHRAIFRRIVRQATGHRTLYLRADRGREIVGILPLVHLRSRVFGNYLVGLPYFNHAGVLASDEAAGRALVTRAGELARSAGASHVELRQLGPAEWMPWPSKSHKVEMMLDLPETTDALWKSLRSKLRSQIRRPEKAGIYARIGGVELLDHFYSVFARNMRDLGTPVYGRRFFETFMAHLRGEARIVVCYLSGRPVGAGIVVGFRDVLEIPWASTVREANHLSPNMLLYWKVLEYAVEHGYRRFDFGRSTPGEGTFKFKQQWGAKPVPLHWYYWMRDGGDLPEINPDNPRYALAIRAWQRLPVVVTRVVGPHLVKNLP